MMLAGLSMWHAGSSQVVILGDAARAQTLLVELSRHYLPFTVVIPGRPGAHQAAIAAALPFVGAMSAKDGAATAFVCRDFACREPATTPETLAAQLAPSA
jgi:uncharacterized protein YyaL (SSP411 family)